MSDERHDAVSRRAYELWEQEGGEHGRHEDHWHRAASEQDAAPAGGNITAPDGTTMPVATAIDAEGAARQPAEEPADSPAATPAAADRATEGKTPGKAGGKATEPADSPAASVPGTASAPAAKAPPKPRKSRTK